MAIIQIIRPSSNASAVLVPTAHNALPFYITYPNANIKNGQKQAARASMLGFPKLENVLNNRR
eukprot:2624317-Amphidinium_carterae.1